jgi:hypothetical protein
MAYSLTFTFYLSEKKRIMSYATGHNSFTSQYLLNIATHLLQILQIMYNKREKNIFNASLCALTDKRFV